MAKKQDSKEQKEPREKDSRDNKENKKEKPVAVAQPKKPAHVHKPERENFRGIVRIAGKDMKGEVPLKQAVTRVKGISHTLAVSATAVLQRELSIQPTIQVGELSEEQIDKIDKILQNLQDHTVLPYLLNRRCDYTTGKNRHVIMNDLLFDGSQDVEREKKLYTWKGYRHAYSQKVRGQRTRNTGRTGMAVGVLRKAILAAQQAAAKPAGASGGGGAAASAAAAPAAGAKPAEKKAAAPAEKK